MHNCILKSHLSVEHRENYSQNTVRKLFHKIFFQNFPFAQILFFFCPNFISPFPELPEILYAKTHISHSVPTSHNSTLPPLSRILFLHFYRCTYPVTVDRRLLATSVSCPHLPSPLAIRLTPPKNPRRAPSRRTLPNSPQIKIPPHLQTPFPAKKIRHLFRRPNNQNTQPTSPVCLRIKYVNSQSFPQVHFLSAVRIYYSKTTRR